MKKLALLILLLPVMAFAQMPGSFLTPRNAGVRHAIIFYAGDATGANFAARHYDLIIGAGGGYKATMKAINPNLKVIEYLTMSTLRDNDTVSMRAWCNAKIAGGGSASYYNYDSMFLWTTAAMDLRFVDPRNGTVYTKSIGAGTHVQTNTWASWREALDMTFPASRDWLIYKTMAATRTSLTDGIMQDEAYDLFDVKWGMSGSAQWPNQLVGHITNSGPDHLDVNRWDHINPATGLRWRTGEVLDSLWRCKLVWMGALGDSLNNNSKFMMTNMAAYGIMGLDDIAQTPCYHQSNCNDGLSTYTGPTDNVLDAKLHQVGVLYGEGMLMSPQKPDYMPDSWRFMDSLGTVAAWSGGYAAFWYYIPDVSVTTYGIPRTQMYNYCSYLMAQNPSNCYYFVKQSISSHHNSNDYYGVGYPTRTSGSMSDTLLSWCGAYGVDIGSPAGFRSLVTAGVWKRQYTKGIVVWNNTGGTATVALGGTYAPVASDGTLGAGVTTTNIPSITGQIFVSTTIKPIITSSTPTVVEGNNLTFNVTTDSIPTQNIIFNYAATSGSATSGASCTAGVDFILKSGTDTILAGQTSKSITVATCDDGTAESSETITFTLSNVTPITVLTVTPSSGTITDNDTTTAIVSTPPSATEGQQLAFVVTRSSNVGAYTITYRTNDGTAQAPGDYVAQTTGQLTIPDGSFSGTIFILTNTDAVAEPTENMSVTLLTVSKGTITNATCQGNILDGTTPPSNANEKKLKLKKG